MVLQRMVEMLQKGLSVGTAEAHYPDNTEGINPKSRCWQDCISYESSRGEAIPLFFLPASSGHLHSLAHGPFLHLPLLLSSHLLL